MARVPVPHYPEIPVIGEWFGKLNHITNLYGNPCSPDFEIWVYAYWTQTPQLLLTIFKPDPLDTWFDRFGKPHKRRRRWKFRVMDHLLPKQPVPGGRAGWAIFRMAQFAQRIGWYMLIVDATLDYIIVSTSTAYQLTGCQGVGVPWAQLEHDAFPIGPDAHSGDIMGNWTIRDQDGFFTDRFGITIPPNTQATLTLDMKTVDPGPVLQPEASWSAQLWNITAGKPIGQSFEPDPKTPRNASAIRTIIPTPGSGSSIKVGVALTKTEGWLRFDGSQFRANGQANIGMTWDP